MVQRSRSCRLQRERCFSRTFNSVVDSLRQRLMRSKLLPALLIDRRVVKTHRHSPVPDDHPDSGAPFKTLKSRLALPERLGLLEDAHAHGRPLLRWDNRQPRQGGLGWMTPAVGHEGTVPKPPVGPTATLDPSVKTGGDTPPACRLISWHQVFQTHGHVPPVKIPGPSFARAVPSAFVASGM